VAIVLILGFTILIWLAGRSYTDAPPIPQKVARPSGETVFSGADITAGQQVFLKYGLMENGTVWGHGAYLGPDFPAAYLHAMSEHAAESLARKTCGRGFSELPELEKNGIRAGVRDLAKGNRYDPATGILTFPDAQAESFERQIRHWTEYFSKPAASGGLPAKYITDPEELRRLTAFFAWTAWASAVNRPGRDYSYTNNFPYDPSVGNVPSAEAYLWSALSLITLLAGTAAILFAFGKFGYLGWQRAEGPVQGRLRPGAPTASQRATLKYFAVVTLLFLAQALVGAGAAHYRADPAGFFGLDISGIFPSHILRTWHLQLAIFWIATAYVGGGLLLAPSLGGWEPPAQAKGVHALFAALVLVVAGSLLGEILGVNRMLGSLWFWLGHQGWEYLDLGRLWQILLAVALAFWICLLVRAVAPALKDPARRQMGRLFLAAAGAIPLFYLPAMFFGSTTHFTVVDTWRFWIIHLWVEGFFELFVTVMVALIFHQLGLIRRQTAARVIYLDALLYLGSGIVGTAHHWYWTGQASVAMALAATFSAMEVVPLTLLTLDAWDFVQVTRAGAQTAKARAAAPHRLTFYFLIAVGVWNFIGAGIFGFLINLPIVSYFEAGTLLTPNHGHAALMGVFGMLAMALVVFAIRQVSTDDQWARREKLLWISFWGLNAGLALMVITNLFPGGVYQLHDVLKNGYWHARSTEFLGERLMGLIEWLRMPADLVFIFAGVVPAAIAAIPAYLEHRRARQG
jgi:nitric oxide reductase subunit B